MRLIDADALLENAKKYVYQSDMATTIALGIAETWIKDAPTVDAAPARHGLWEEKMEHAGYVCCSVCHDCYVEKEWLLNLKWGWCPQCGARMDGGDNHA